MRCQTPSGAESHVDDTPRTALEHARQHRPARTRMGHDVHVPHALPDTVRRRQRIFEVERLGTETGVRDEHVHPTVARLGGAHHGLDGCGIDDIALHREPAAVLRRRLGERRIEIGGDDSGRAAAHRLAAQRPADAAPRAGHHDHLAVELHDDSAGQVA